MGAAHLPEVTVGGKRHLRRADGPEGITRLERDGCAGDEQPGAGAHVEEPGVEMDGEAAVTAEKWTTGRPATRKPPAATREAGME
jgi:hypothetical protein